jgi:hypothetical protein
MPVSTKDVRRSFGFSSPPVLVSSFGNQAIVQVNGAWKLKTGEALAAQESRLKVKEL